MSLSITDVARRTGVPTSTLRYYDRIGLLASAGRADNGYRQYDERTLDRLRFIGPPPAGRPLTMAQLTGLALDISCTLSHEQMSDRVSEWQAVLAHVRARSSLEGGIRLTFGPETNIAEVARLAEAEWACCSFFGFALTVDRRGTALEVQAPAAAQPLLASVFGVAQ